METKAKRTRVRPIKATTYASMLQSYNRDRSTKTKKTECECGKLIFPNQMEKHLQTNYHKQLVERRRLYEEFMKTENERQQCRMEELKKTIERLNNELTDLYHKQATFETKSPDPYLDRSPE